MIKNLNKIPHHYLFIVNLLLTITLGVINYFADIEFSFSIFYFLPIIIAAWYLGFRSVIIFSLICGTLWSLVDLMGGHIYSSDYIFRWNALMHLIIFLIIAVLINRLKRDSEQITKAKLAEQKNYNIIKTSQKITELIAANVTKHNSEILRWIIQQKNDGKVVPYNLEKASRNIGSNLEALTKICYGQLPSKNMVDLDEFLNLLKTEIKKIDNKNIKKNNSNFT